MGRRGAIAWACWVAATTAACTKAPSPAGAVGSTIALLTNGSLAVLNPDQGSVSFVDPSSLSTLATVPVGGDPRSLLQVHSGAVWIATYHGGSVVAVDPVAMSVVTSTPGLCQGPVGLAEAPDGSWIALACEWSGQILRLDPTTMAPTVLASGLRRPRGVAIVGDSVVVSLYTSDVVEIGPDGTTSTISLVPTAAPYRPALTLMTANLAAAVVPAFGHLFVPHELVNHTGDTTDEAVAEDYGTVLNGTPKINAAVTRLVLSGDQASVPPETPPVYSRFDAATHELSGPVAAAPFGDRFLLVAHDSTDDVAVLDTTATDPNQRLVATYEVGFGPAGVAVDAVHSLAYVDNAFDGSVSRLDLTLPWSSTAPSYQPQQTQVRGLPSPYSDAARAGRQLFYDATNAHVTPSRVVACATCHPGGSDDGLVWFMHTPTIPLKRRRTPNLANSRTDTAPFHWDGSFATMTDLVNGTITDLMAGDDLLVDATTVQAFVDEIVQAPVPPPQDQDAVARGQVVFQSSAAGCAGCHSGADFTDDLNHAVLNPMSLTSDDVFTSANTPDLHALFDRSPFFHDGRASSLQDLLSRPDASMHGNTSGLSAGQLSDLIAYLNSL